MKLVIFGTRVPSSQEIDDAFLLAPFTAEQITEVISASGPFTSSGELWARFNKKKIKRIFVAWDRYGVAAVPIRNREMASCADVGICFWDGTCKGTFNMINELKQLGKEVICIQIPRAHYVRTNKNSLKESVH